MKTECPHSVGKTDMKFQHSGSLENRPALDTTDRLCNHELQLQDSICSDTQVRPSCWGIPKLTLQ